MDASVPAFVKRTFTAKMLGKALAKPQARWPRPNNGRVMNRGCRKSLEVWKYVVDNGQLRNWPNEPALYYKNLGAYGVRYLFVICGFSVAETENLGRPFLLGRALEAEGS